MTSQHRLLSGALGLTLILAACGGSASTPAPTGNGGGSQPTDNGGGTTPAPTDNSGGATPTDAGFSLTPGNASALEAMIPDKVGSLTITKSSFDYGSIPWASLSGAFGSGNLDQTLKDNGKTLADVAFAMGISTSASPAGLPTMVYAFQVKGLDAAKFIDGVDSSYATGTTLTIGGKQVKGSITAGFGQVTYLHNDVAFIALGSEADLNTLVAALP